MKYLFDEHFGSVVAPAMNAVGLANGDQFEHILDHAKGTQDADIPSLCKEQSCDVLVTLNVRDFGAKKVLYQDLLTAGISVVVVRPGRMKMTDPNQVAIIAMRYQQMITSLRAAGAGCVLLVMTPADVRTRTLDDLVAEIERGEARLP